MARSRRSRTAARALLTVILLATAYVIFVQECSYGGGMGAAYRTCKCRGIEWVLYDKTPADGPRKSVCIGVVASKRCFQAMGGPEVDCSRPRSGS